MPRKKIPKTIEAELKEKTHFRVAIFGSARTKKSDQLYKDVKSFARKIGKNKWDIVTGGGMGLMGAASEGHALGDNHNNARNIGLTIRLPWEVKANTHLEIKKHFKGFGPRLAAFMKLSDAVVIVPGGIGTTLELFFTWQLLQVKHKEPIPIILVGTMWKKLIEWVRKYPLKDGWISPENMDFIVLARNYDHAFKILEKEHTAKAKSKFKK